jgi:hypothetical protein
MTRLLESRSGSWRKSLAAAAVLAMASGASGNERARTYAYHEVIAGAAAPSSFDLNGDGVKGHYVTFAGRTSLGMAHGAILVEYDFLNAGLDASCSSGTIRIPVLASSGNRTVTRSESQIFMRDDPASALLCLDPVSGAFTMSLKGVFAGGLGKYAGATGTYEYKGSGNVLLTDSTGMPLGGFVLETRGRIRLPHGQ